MTVHNLGMFQIPIRYNTNAVAVEPILSGKLKWLAYEMIDVENYPLPYPNNRGHWDADYPIETRNTTKQVYHWHDDLGTVLTAQWTQIRGIYAAYNRTPYVGPPYNGMELYPWVKIETNGNAVTWSSTGTLVKIYPTDAAQYGLTPALVSSFTLTVIADRKTGQITSGDPWPPWPDNMIGAS